MMRLLSACLFLLASPVLAQDAEIQKQLIQRDQRTDAFALQLRHSVEAARVPPASRPVLESRQLWERQRLENVSEKQLLEERPQERLKAAQERCAIVCP